MILIWKKNVKYVLSNTVQPQKAIQLWSCLPNSAPGIDVYDVALL